MGGFKLGRIFGFPIEVRFSFLLLMLFAFLVYGGLAGVLLLLVTFASVLVHELGHALVARRLGVHILGIDLHFFGGAAKMASMPDRPRDELLIAGAGPAVSFVLALIGLLAYRLSGWSALGYLMTINLILGAFNLLPALPMDGGRILRAVLAGRMGRLKATEIAVKVAKFVAAGLGIFALIEGQFFLVAMSVLLWFMAGAELRAARLWHYAQSGGGCGPLFGGDPFAGSAGPFGFRSPFGRSASVRAEAEVVDREVEVLDRERQPVGGTFTGRGAGFSVEEQRGDGFRRWVVRGPNGEVLITTETPLRW